MKSYGRIGIIYLIILGAWMTSGEFAFAWENSGNQSEHDKQGAGISSENMGSKPISKTNSSQEIREVQTKLNEKGFHVGTIDGIMGPKTVQALKSFQSKNKEPVTGKIDHRTLAALGVATPGRAGTAAEEGKTYPEAQPTQKAEEQK